MTTRYKKKNFLPVWLKDSWIKNNMFKFKVGDATAYFVLYIIIPVVITAISLKTLSTDNLSVIYCYITIFISAANCIYDGANRWDSTTKSVLNTKIFIIFISNTVIAVYCLCVILYILISNNICRSFDKVLFVYFFTVFVSLFDVVACFVRKMAFKDCV